MSRRVAYLNARLVDPASGLDTVGALLTENGRIADLGPALTADGVPADAEVVDCGGRVLAPGLVDMRVKIGEPGEDHKETIASVSEAAAAGGVTALACLPDTDPAIDSEPALEFVARRAREIRRTKIFACAAVTRGCAGQELAELGLLSEAGAVAFTDGRRAVADSLVMMRALGYASAFDLLLIQHPEDPALAQGGVATAGAMATRLGLAPVPREAEVILLERDLRLVALTGARYHAAHVSTTAAIEALRQAKRRGLPVTCDTAPPYFALTEADIGAYRTFAKLSPPLRGAEDRAAVIAGLADGTIDAIASDHQPQDQESKRVPFAVAEPGGIGVETLLPLGLELVHNGHLDMAAMLALVTCRPADLLRLPLGRLAPGGPADLVVFDPEIGWIVDAPTLRSKSKNSPFDGRMVQGRAWRTVVDGRTVFAADGAAAR